MDYFGKNQENNQRIGITATVWKYWKGIHLEGRAIKLPDGAIRIDDLGVID